MANGGRKQEPLKIEKPGTVENLVALYKCYTDMVLKQYDLIWSGFRSYALVISAILAAVAFIYKGWLEANTSTFCPTDEPRLLLVGLSGLGALLSLCWFAANRNHWHWEDVKQRAAWFLEDEILNLSVGKNVGELMAKHGVKHKGFRTTAGMFDSVYQHRVSGWPRFFRPTIAFATQAVIVIVFGTWLIAGGFFATC